VLARDIALLGRSQTIDSLQQLCWLRDLFITRFESVARRNDVLAGRGDHSA
jgi:hypothetical protein